VVHRGMSSVLRTESRRSLTHPNIVAEKTEIPTYNIEGRELIDYEILHIDRLAPRRRRKLFLAERSKPR
jgi:hypothetical protein